MFGTRQKEDVVAANNVLKEIARNYEKETPLIPLDIFFKCHDNEKAVLIAKSDKKEVTVIGDVPEKAINKPMSEESLKERLSKFGGTQYFLKNIEINLDDGLILPASKINEMRRNAVSSLMSRKKSN